MTYVISDGGDRAESSASMNRESMDDEATTARYFGQVEMPCGFDEFNFECDGQWYGARYDEPAFDQSADYAVEIDTPQQQVVDKRYFLSPSPKFDAVFDDLLEGGANIHSTSIRERASMMERNLSKDISARKVEYLNELLCDEQKLRNSNEFLHLRDLVVGEIARVRKAMRIRKGDPLFCPKPNPMRDTTNHVFANMKVDPVRKMPPTDGPFVTVVEKVFVPTDEYPTFNFIGRLLGPRGRTIKRIEMESDCKVTICGRRNESDGTLGIGNQDQRHDSTKGPLHVRIEATDQKERAYYKLRRVKALIERMLVPVNDDDLKQNQLRELASIRHYHRGPKLTDVDRIDRVTSVLSNANCSPTATTTVTN